ncbi:MAG: choice-of-anchor D domain-containing protein [Thioploca sp.]|nr:choice-of-anchor D domain-containing protein [Thioploca sp.]
MSINIQRNQWLKTTVVLCSFLLGISLSAEAIQALELTPEKLTFKAGDKKTATLKPTGGEVTIASIKITGSNKGEFTFTTVPDKNCGGKVATGKDCKITITFNPALTAAGTRTATLEVVDADDPTFVYPVELTGTAGNATPTEVQAEPTVKLSKKTVTFKNQAVKTTSAEQTVTLENTGKADLLKISLKITGDNSKDFAVATDPEKNCGGTLAPKAKCQIKLTFTPAAAGARQATVEMSSNAKSSPDKIELTGTGTEAAQTVTATLTPAAVDFKKQAVKTPSAEKTVTLKNTSKTDLSKLTINITGDKDFAATNDCGTTLAASKTCQIKIIFTPKAAGDKTATLEAKSDKTSLDKVELTGMGDDGSTPQTVTATPTKLDFGNVIVGTVSNSQKVTLTNETKSDVTDLQITLVDEKGQFSTTSSTSGCGSTLGTGKNCVVEITFMPPQVGKIEATLNMTSGKTSLLKVPLMGNGVEYPPSLKAMAIDLSTGNIEETTPVQIKGGVSLADPIDFKSSLTVKKTDKLIVSAALSSLPEEDIGKEIDVIAIGYYVREPDLKVDGPSMDNCDPSLVETVEQGGYYIVKNDNSQDYCDWIVDGGAEGGWCAGHKTRDKEQATQHYVEKWSGNLADLEPLYTVVPDETGSLILSEQNNMVMYQGTIDGTGHVCVYLGYRTLAEGEGIPVFLTFNEDPIVIRVTD